jgi:TolB-like protein/Tfp pilus assembly protein PilF
LWPTTRPPGTSVAVLPFVNLSGDTSQEFFSDGVTEEITSALAKIPDLPVVGRTSAFQYKGKTGDLRVIGRTLNASYVLEGSVRKVGDRVRITAQLVSTKTGDHIWTDSYDRHFQDIFAVQEDVAQAIAGALRVPLGLKQGEKLVSDRTANTNSYQDYLRARALFRARDMTRAIPLLERTVARDPGYAPAWAMLARAYVPASGAHRSIYEGTIEQASIHFGGYAAKADYAARQALRLDPRNAAAHAALAQYAIYQHDWEKGRDEYNQALALDPNDPDTLVQYASAFLGLLGYIKQEFGVRQKVQSLEPFVPVYNREMSATLLNLGQTQAAIDLLQQGVRDGVPAAGSLLVQALAAAGRFEEAADVLLSLPDGPPPRFPQAAIETGARLLRAAPKPLGALKGQPDLPGLSFVYLFAGAPDRALADPERELAVKGAPRPAFHRIWGPAYAATRKGERFKSFVRNAGMLDYWRKHGWPDFCRPVGREDFTCI